jgi:hypothetical protein
MRALLSWDMLDSDHGWQCETQLGANGTAIITLLGPEQVAPAPFVEAIPSWSAATPAGSWIEVQLRARLANCWTGFYRIAQWDSLRESSMRRSFDAQKDADGHVATDTLILAGPADAVQPRLLLHTTAGEPPSIRVLRLALSGPVAPRATGACLAARELPVPARSQMIYPNGGNVWCSPTAIAMLLAYWHAQTGDERLAPFVEHSAIPELVVPQVYDPIYEGHGNWAFNTAFAAGVGVEAYVARLAGLEQIEPWIAAGVPVVISVSCVGISNAAAPASTGHLLIVAGFDERGNVIVADPAGRQQRDVRRVYDAAELERAWLDGSGGTVYLIYPHAWPAPQAAGAPGRPK